MSDSLKLSHLAVVLLTTTLQVEIKKAEPKKPIPPPSSRRHGDSRSAYGASGYGAATETELEDCKLRIEDAKNATFASIEEEAESEDSYNSSNNSHEKNQQKHKPRSFRPSTPQAAVNFRAPKRRKGIPHRAPLSASALEYY